jgi:hypothetical protein
MKEAFWLGLLIVALVGVVVWAEYFANIIDQAERRQAAVVLDLTGPVTEIARADKCVTDTGEACVVCQVKEGEWLELGDVCHTDPAARVWHDAKHIDPRGSVWQ